MTELTASGGLAGQFAPSGANFNGPGKIAIDAAGNVWVVNALGGSVTELTSSGALVGNFDPSGANFNGPGRIAIDAAGNVWVTNGGVNTLGNPSSSVTELNSSGGLVGNFAPIGANFKGPNDVAIDSAGNVWVTNFHQSLTELVGAARPVLTPRVACLKQSPPHAVFLP